MRVREDRGRDDLVRTKRLLWINKRGQDSRGFPALTIEVCRKGVAISQKIRIQQREVEEPGWEECKVLT
jgi:hypothetical protein